MNLDLIAINNLSLLSEHNNDTHFLQVNDKIEFEEKEKDKDYENITELNDIEYPLGGATIRMHAFMLGLIEDGHQVGCIVYNGLESKNKDKQISLIESYKANHGIKFFRWIFYRIPRLIKSIK